MRTRPQALELEATLRDCAIAVCLPTRQEKFLAGLTATPASDFLDLIALQHPALTAQGLWDQVYAPVAATLLEILGELQARGVSVVTSATLADCHKLIGDGFKVVTLVAHWRPAWLRAGHVKHPAVFTALIDRNRDTCPLMRELHTALSSHQPDNIKGAEGSEPVRRTAEELSRTTNSIMRRLSLFDWETDPPGAATPFIAARNAFRLRDELDGFAEDIIQPGNRLEFSDGLYDVVALARGIPPSFAGTLNLLCCNSVVLADELKRRNRQMECIVNEKNISLLTQMIFLKYTILSLEEEPGQFVERAEDIRVELGELLNGSN